ncbi:MAG TPA: hypothetical protein VFE62_07965 [Gemmataceae bacterium]|nr:hypothetical protein [Gemmataceae bacterium]
MQSVEKALFVVERTNELGRMDGRILAKAPGWDRVQASRYLTTLARLGWLERLTGNGRPVYVLGRKLLALGLSRDLRI